jgi:biopolymer transport protein ExbD
MDLTSMIDVVFLLLVFFLVTLQFRVLEGRFDSHLPKDVGAGAESDRLLIDPLPLHIEVLERGGCRVRLAPGRWGGVDAVAAFVRRALASDPATRARISTGPGVTYEHVIDVVDECVGAGLTDIAFARGPA